MIRFLSSWRSLALAVFLSAAFSGAARAAVIIDIYQSGSNVVATGSGNLLLPSGASPSFGFGGAAVAAKIADITGLTEKGREVKACDLFRKPRGID